MKIRQFAKYTGQGTPIGTERYGDILIGIDKSLPYSQDYAGVKWYVGPDEDSGYVITLTTEKNSIILFFVTESFDDNEFITLTVNSTGYQAESATDAKNWLFDNGYWTSYP